MDTKRTPNAAKPPNDTPWHVWCFYSQQFPPYQAPITRCPTRSARSHSSQTHCWPLRNSPPPLRCWPRPFFAAAGLGLLSRLALLGRCCPPALARHPAWARLRPRRHRRGRRRWACSWSLGYMPGAGQTCHIEARTHACTVMLSCCRSDVARGSALQSLFSL